MWISASVRAYSFFRPRFLSRFVFTGQGEGIGFFGGSWNGTWEEGRGGSRGEEGELWPEEN